jgi:hypothetical protein
MPRRKLGSGSGELSQELLAADSETSDRYFGRSGRDELTHCWVRRPSLADGVAEGGRLSTNPGRLLNRHDRRCRKTQPRREGRSRPGKRCGTVGFDDRHASAADERFPSSMLGVVFATQAARASCLHHVQAARER